MRNRGEFIVEKRRVKIEPAASPVGAKGGNYQ